MSRVQSTMSMQDLGFMPLRQRWQELRRNDPGLSSVHAAKRLKVTECELVASECGRRATRLHGDFSSLMHEMPRLGRVMAETRNAYCTHRCKGRYEHVRFGGNVGVVHGEEIDLRLYLKHWAYAFAFREENPEGTQAALRFFDIHGKEVHHIHLLNESDWRAYTEIVMLHADHDQSPVVSVLPEEPFSSPGLTPVTMDLIAFHEAWDGLENMHRFYGLPEQHGLSRMQALRLAGPRRARTVPVAAYGDLLRAVKESFLPIILLAGNNGCVQLYTGTVASLRQEGEVFAVGDSEFDLHLAMPAVAEIWLVRKPTVDGIINSLELFDKYGHTIAIMLGQRKPGWPENPAWRAILNGLPGIGEPL